MSKYIVNSTRNKGGNGHLLALPLFIITAFCFGLALWSNQPVESTSTASKAPSQQSEIAPSKLPDSSQAQKSHLSEVAAPETAAAAAPPATATPTTQSTPTQNNGLLKQWEKWRQQFGGSKESNRN